MVLSTPYTFTLAAMDKPASLRATRAFGPIALLIAVALALAPAAHAQSAGDRQYQDPLGGDRGADAAPAPPSGGDEPVCGGDPAPAPSAGDDPLPAGAEPAAALPRTGGAPALLAGLGLVLLAAGLALRPRRPLDS